MNWSSKWPDKSNPLLLKQDFVNAEKEGKAIESKAIEGKHTPILDFDTENGWYKTTFHFQDGNKRRSIDVTIVGDLALDYDDDGWNIYHVPTGTVFTKAVPAWNTAEINGHINELYSYEPSELLAWMKKVQEKHDVSWTMLRLLTPDNYNNKGDSAKRIIKEWCLSVPVKE